MKLTIVCMYTTSKVENMTIIRFNLTVIIDERIIHNNSLADLKFWYESEYLNLTNSIIYYPHDHNMT